MPSVSAAQHRAMEAAAHGHSNLGIPRKVGEEFSEADRGRHFGGDADPAPDNTGRVAAGTIFVAPDGAVLLLLRSEHDANWAGHWDLPGGKADDGETALDAARREADEEIGFGYRHACLGEPTLLREDTTPTGMVFSTFLQPVRYRFPPELDAEHAGFVWVQPTAVPTPTHPAVARTLIDLVEGAAKGDLTQDAERAEEDCDPPAPAQDALGMDELPGESVRSKDADGHLHVSVTPISKATVNPYYGREIPDHERLGLDPQRKYMLLRHPDELARAAATFNGLPLLRRHVATSADDYQQDDVVGATGTEAAFSAPYLVNAIVVWSQADIDAIEAGEKRELSAAYRYRADMTPGTYEGVPYDGVMRDIVGNHVALVERGRAGPDVLVGDEMPAGLAPNSGVPAMAGSREDRKDGGDMAKAKDGDLPEVGGSKGEGPAAKDRRAHDAAEGESLKERLKDKLGAEDWKAACDSIDDLLKAKHADDEDDEEAEDEEKEDDRPDPQKTNSAEDEEDDKDEKVSKKAMDAAIDTAVTAAVTAERKRQQAVSDARAAVRPYVGELHMAFDSADDVYATTLRSLGVDVKGVHPSAYPALLKMAPRPARPGEVRRESALAMDGRTSGGKSTAERFPEAAKVRVGAAR